MPGVPGEECRQEPNGWIELLWIVSNESQGRDTKGLVRDGISALAYVKYL